MESGDTEWGPSLRPDPSVEPCSRAAFRLRPLDSLGRREGITAHLEGPKETGVKEDWILPSFRDLKVERWPELNRARNILTCWPRESGAGVDLGRYRESTSDPQCHLPRPPRFVARSDSRSLRATELSTAKPQHRVPRQSTCSPLSKPSKPTLGSQRPLRTPLPLALGRAGLAKPSHPPETSSLGRLGLRLPFLFLVSCHCRCGPLRRRAPGLPGEWRRLQLLRLLWPSLTPRSGPVLKVLSARRPAVRWKFAGGWLGAGEGGGER